MKNIFRFMMTALVCAAIAGGCEKREVMAGAGDGYGADGTGTGYLVLSAGGLTVEFDGERVNDAEQGAQSAQTRAGETPELNDFWIEIIDTETEQLAVARFKYGEYKYGELGSEPIAVPYGNYCIRAYSGDKYEVEGTAFWAGDGKGQPSWAGQSTSFNITRDHTKERPYNAGDIKCTMQTVKVTLVLEKALAERFNPDKTAIKVAILDADRYEDGNHPHSVKYTNMEHPYGLAELDKISHAIASEERASDISYLAVINEDGGNAMFVYIDTEFTEADGTATHLQLPLTIAGKEKGVQPGQWRKITLYLDAVDEETGRITIGAKIETWVYDEEVVVDVAQAVVDLGERVIMDMDPQMLCISSADFDLRDGQVNEISSYTSDGKYSGSARFGIVNNTDQPIERFLVNITSQNSLFSSFLKTNGITDWLDIMSDTSGSNSYVELYGYGFPRRSKIQEYGSEGFEFSLEGLMNKLYNYPGRHDVSIAVVNGEFYYRADLKLNVTNNGGTVTPPPAGGAPSIVWVDHNIDQRYEVTDDLQVEVSVDAPAGIKEFMVEIDGALRDDLPSVGLVEEFSLVNPDKYKEGLGTSIEGLGFPIGNNVLNKTHVGFDISDFMVLLGSFYGNNDFRLTVTDNNGVTVTKTVMLYVND